MRLGVALAALVAVMPGCTNTPSAEATSDLPTRYAATEDRPYSISLPEGWSVEDTVHADGGSFISSGEGGATGGKIYGIREPSGELRRHEEAPTQQELEDQLAGADTGAEVETNPITVDGRDGWEAVVVTDSAVSMIADVDLDGAGIFFFLFGRRGDVSPELFRDIVRSVDIDEALLQKALS